MGHNPACNGETLHANTANKSSVNVTKFKYLGIELINKNCMTKYFRTTKFQEYVLLFGTEYFIFPSEI
jgi:hypothetical protein